MTNIRFEERPESGHSSVSPPTLTKEYFLSGIEDEYIANAYALSGDREKAVETYTKGIEVSMAHGHPSMANEYRMTLDLDFS